MANGTNVRNFAKLFTNLNPGQKAEFELALNDMQDSLDLSSLETTLDLLKRKPDQSLPIPQLTITPTVRGGIIEWEPLDDQRISFFEVDVSDLNNFATFTTVPTFGNRAVIDGLTSSRFVRVRGVRRDKTTTPYSEVGSISPKLFDVTVRTAEAFYINVIGSDPNIVLGGDGSPMDFTPFNPDGNSMVWGFANIYADPAVAMLGLDNITLKLFAKVISEDGLDTLSDTEYWSVSCNEYWGCYSIGPVTIPNPDLNQRLQLRLEVTDETTHLFDCTKVFYCHLNALELGIQ
jgi:hypothetical protein